MIKSKKEAIATHLDMSYEDLEWHRYHYGHTSQPVYAFDKAYYCATKGSQKPAKYLGYGGDEMWEWQKKEDDYLTRQGYTIWICPVVSE